MGLDPATRSRRSSRAAAVAIVAAVSLGATVSTACFALKSDHDVPIDGGPNVDAPQSDFYVDPSGVLDGSFLTITEAITAANASSADGRVIHVAAGNYRAPRETFPLVLRDGVSLEGSTTGQTSITSTGSTDVAPPPTLTALVSAAIVVGDAVKTSRIAHITFIRTTSTLDGQEAVLCDRGNAGSDETPNVLIDDVVVRGFEVGVRAIAFPGMSGCHVRITGSSFEDGSYGVLSQGIVRDDGSPISVVSVHLGDGSLRSGNLFRRLRVAPGHSAGLNGSGLYALEGTVGVTAAHNSFGDGDRGISIVQGRGADMTHGVTIDGNDFGFLEMSGLVLHGNTTVATISNNHFHDILQAVYTSMVVGPMSGIGLSARLYAGVGALEARGNTFETCSIGVQILATELSDSDLERIDFGLESQPGNNVFRCNSANQAETNVGSGTTLGGDVFFEGAGTTSILPSFAGNTWDHLQPTAQIGVNSVDPGIDILAQGTTLDATYAKLSSVDCPAPHVRGP